MNGTHPTVTIDLVLDRHSTKEVLRAVLHSILFHRLFGTVKAQTFEVLDVTMPGVDDVEMKQLVDEKVDAFWKGVEGGNKRGQAYSGHFLRKTSKEELVLYGRGRGSMGAMSLKTMLTYASSERGRSAVPLITKADGISPFPIKIAVKVGGIEVG
ncbi:uncharacterized protein FIBRA_05965 [Fibroporia radiculosa]|uniref:Autophagy-related protein 101 n=1 Tax=Fibroporia radiculosa TaxID=599839 RepID=J4IB04_9APHY|nr:uncharacterized protein FIBRA_05965 [Fibroporia radiculosa]CCM03816.1 predicted protein [Fibroporia radiculosa]